MVVLSLLLACSSPRCPAGSAPIPALEARVLARLRPEELPATTTTCFAEGLTPSITPSGQLSLDPRWDEAALAARAAHLLLHRRQGLPPDADCPARRAAEIEARNLEERLRREAGLDPALPRPLDPLVASCEDAPGDPP